MTYCANCNAEMPDDAQVCGNCGIPRQQATAAGHAADPGQSQAATQVPWPATAPDRTTAGSQLSFNASRLRLGDLLAAGGSGHEHPLQGLACPLLHDGQRPEVAHRPLIERGGPDDRLEVGPHPDTSAAVAAGFNPAATWFFLPPSVARRDFLAIRTAGKRAAGAERPR